MKAQQLPANKKPWPADKVERRPLDSLIPQARNARTHSDEQVAAIAASMREWGWTNPVLVDEEGTIIAGHGRTLAARKLGFTEAPVMVAEGWSEAQKRAYLIADNQLAIGGADWHLEMLAGELHGLNGEGFDLGLLGFDEDQLQELMFGGIDREDRPGGSFLDDVVNESDTRETAADPGIEAPAGWVSLSFAMTPEDRDSVLAWLNSSKSRLGVDTAAQVLIALAGKANN
jgi:hypothetical protein